MVVIYGNFLFFSNVNITYRGVEWDGQRVDGVGWEVEKQPVSVS